MNTEIRRLAAEQLAADVELGEMLATYSGRPAVFYQKAPSDSRPGWGKEPRYPRVDFNVDMRHDSERRAAGTMTFNIWCSTECAEVAGLDPDRAIEARLMELIGGTFYTGSDRVTLCAEWERSDEFNLENTQKDASLPEIYGLSVSFDLMEFPEQLTGEPDPIRGLNEWTKRYFEGITVIAHDETPPIWKPTDESPALYWRFEGTASDKRQSYAVTWYTGAFAAHVIAESVSERNRWTKALIERLQLAGEIILADGSPMFIQRISVRHGADALREGQIELTGMYGVLRPEQPKEKLMHPYMLEGGRK